MVYVASESPCAQDAVARPSWREPGLKHLLANTSWLEFRPLRPHIRCNAVRPEPIPIVPLQITPIVLITPEIDLSDATSPQITIYSSAICPYCVAAKNFLKSKGLDWTEVRIDLDLAERQRMMALAKRTSVPQIFVGDVHVGGYDDMMALHRAGKFEPLLSPEAHGKG